MKTIKINAIRKRHYKGFVYNLELESRDTSGDDLFWIEQSTGIVGHNCFPKDVNALISTMERSGVNPQMLKLTWEMNKKYRKNWDWATNPSAVKGKKENV